MVVVVGAVGLVVGDGMVVPAVVVASVVVVLTVEVLMADLETPPVDSTLPTSLTVEAIFLLRFLSLFANFVARATA